MLELILCLFFPKRCLVCQDVVSYGEDFCGKCFREKGDRAHDYSIGDDNPINISSAFLYGDDISKAILSLKSIPDKRMAMFYANEVVNAVNAKFSDINFDALIPVPMSNKTKRKRGFNHAEILALKIGESMRIRVIANALTRTDDSLTQRSLDAAERKTNAFRSFGYSGKVDLNGKKLLIIDDVITTGATIEACAKALLSAGAEYVAAASIAIVNSASK